MAEQAQESADAQAPPPLSPWPIENPPMIYRLFEYVVFGFLVGFIAAELYTVIERRR